LNKGHRRKDKKDSNVEIRIEGKDQPSSQAKPDKNSEESFDKKANAKIDVSDIEKIVFSKVNLSDMHHGIYSDPTQASSVAKKGSEYVEEESYVNPTNLDNQSDIDFEDEKLKSIDAQGRILQSLKNGAPNESFHKLNVLDDSDLYGSHLIERNTIKLSYNDICLDKDEISEAD